MIEPMTARTAAPGGSRRRGLRGGGAFLLLLAAAPASAQFSAQPVILDLRPVGGAAVTTFSVRNEGEAALQFRVYAGDFDQPPEGGHRFLEVGEHPRSCVERLQFYPDNLSLEPGGAGEVRVVMEPGDSTCWSVIFVQSVSRSDSGFRIAQRIGIKVFGVDGRVRPAGEIRRVGVDADSATGGRAAVIEFVNTGEAPLRPEGEVEVRNEGGDVVAVVPVESFTALPGRTRQTRVALPADLPRGFYIAVPILDFGADYLAGGQATFEVRREE